MPMPNARAVVIAKLSRGEKGRMSPDPLPCQCQSLLTPLPLPSSRTERNSHSHCRCRLAALNAAASCGCLAAGVDPPVVWNNFTAAWCACGAAPCDHLRLHRRHEHVGDDPQAPRQRSWPPRGSILSASYGDACQSTMPACVTEFGCPPCASSGYGCALVQHRRDQAPAPKIDHRGPRGFSP